MGSCSAVVKYVIVRQSKNARQAEIQSGGNNEMALSSLIWSTLCSTQTYKFEICNHAAGPEVYLSLYYL
jgi:hypothetical protein